MEGGRVGDLASAAAMPTLKWYLRAKMHGKWWGFHAQLLNICTGKGCAGGQGLKGLWGKVKLCMAGCSRQMQSR